MLLVSSHVYVGKDEALGSLPCRRDAQVSGGVLPSATFEKLGIQEYYCLLSGFLKMKCVGYH